MKFATFCILLLIVTLASVTSAATHTITFGSNFYQPSSLNVTVGDVIIWSGSFGAHPLKSSTIPAGAQAIDVNSGTTFQYTITHEGTYNYYCTFHGSPNGQGMAGVILASAASVKETKTADAELLQNYPNPSNAATNISFRLTKSSNIELKVYRIDGSEVATPVSGKWSEGLYTIPFDTTPLEAGIYFYRLIINGEAVTREMIVTK